MIKGQGTTVYGQPQHDPSGFDSPSGSLGAVNRMTNVYFQLLLSSKQALFSPPALSILSSLQPLSTFI